MMVTGTPRPTRRDLLIGGVLDRDLTAVPPGRILGTAVLRTFVG